MKLNMIIVDDNKDLTELLCDYFNMLCDSDIEISGIAYDGIEALELIRRHQPDIVLLDMFMPNLDGFGVLKELKQMQLKKEPKIIFLTAMGQQSGVSEILKLGVECYIEKPFSMDILAAKVKQIGNTVSAAK